jgi:hypothetical protein
MPSLESRRLVFYFPIKSNVKAAVIAATLKKCGAYRRPYLWNRVAVRRTAASQNTIDAHSGDPGSS